MIINLWVFFMLGDSLVDGEPPAYVQLEASERVHATDWCRNDVEEVASLKFHHDYPHHVVCDSGWCRQQVQVIGA